MSRFPDTSIPLSAIRTAVSMLPTSYRSASRLRLPVTATSGAWAATALPSEREDLDYVTTWLTY